MRYSFIQIIVSVLLGGVGLVATPAASPSSVMTARDDFDTRALTAKSPSSMTMLPGTTGSAGPTSSRETSLSLDQPGRFYMEQSYSLSAVSGGGGSASSGLYLNTLNYRFTPLMTAFVDVGFHTPIHSSMPGLEQSEGLGSLVIPRVGLEYRPSDRLSFNFEVVNGPDAWKAWGGSPSGSSLFRSYPGSRNP